MSFTLNSIITIGPFRFRGVHEVKIAMSIHSFINTCNIKVPISCKLIMSETNKTDSIGVFQTVKQFVEGDKVVVQLGYNGKYNTEFEGFVRRVNLTTPLDIECEGYVYQLRKQLTPKSFSNTTLKVVLQYLIMGTEIVLAKDIPDVKIEKLIITGQTGAEVLEELKKHLLLSIFFHGKELFAGLAYTQYKGIVKHKLGWNVIKDNELKVRDAKNVLLKVVMFGVKADGTKIKVEVGDNTQNIQKMKTHFVSDLNSLKKIATKMLTDKKYTGYEGRITTFGLPFFQHGWVSNLEDPRYSDRSGKYLIDSLEVTYNNRGYRRTGGLNVKVS